MQRSALAGSPNWCLEPILVSEAVLGPQDPKNCETAPHTSCLTGCETAHMQND